ncbi:hypothetical protein [Companilactobacillus halodurans]|uniref:Uncharacterized protein n=1 Tax=Companilactobacillus halodurans TaxID=2584183 RepID=A0A5P0ZN72_9LACO|nr:hypothetical protein [Companilactobacillus halodurans]MQS75730.1 hypothetical protein [Companilactobacillus halodurans]MQS98040.1 hypothetical protein [Companilactobacillus halodurans]
MEKRFARKLSFKPLFNSFVLGMAVGIFMYAIFGRSLVAGLIFGLIAFLILSVIVYPRSLPSLYGYWRVTDGNVYYYDYSTWTKRILAIFLPLTKKQEKVSFEDIESYSLIVNKNANKYVPHYIVLKVDDGHDIALDVSWNLLKSGDPEKDVEWVVDFITNKLNQKTVKILQA